ncbi:MAG: HAMP domain-containing histidine kinase [Actinomycetota bacterium]|nr:HAMP domain-containing histidine kinase [Actinomycetota bacterium]
MSIRLRLTVVTVVLAALAVGGAQAATFLLLRNYINKRADASVRQVAQTAVAALTSGETVSLPTFAQTDRPVLVEVRDARGRVVQRIRTSEAATIKVPRDLVSRPGRSRQLGNPGGGPPEFQVIALKAPGGRTVIAAVSLKDMVSTVGHLLYLTLLVGGIALLALALVAAVVLTRSLRPLREIAATADAIASGDLSARAPPGRPRNEVGRVASALNRMLGENEAAFAQRDATEERLRRFLADASHELRTPLTSIRGYAEMFRRGASQHPEDLERAMSAIEQEAARMTVLVEDLLLLARLDDARPLERLPVALDDIAEAAIDAARAVEPDRSIQFEFAERPLSVVGDEARLRQVLDNLFANVRQHTPAGSPAFVGLRAEASDVVLTIEDSGPGVPESERELVFDRFVRPDSQRGRDNGGAGLGLAIARAIVNAHGGEISVRAARPHGSIFEVRLPRLAATLG